MRIMNSGNMSPQHGDGEESSILHVPQGGRPRSKKAKMIVKATMVVVLYILVCVGYLILPNYSNVAVASLALEVAIYPAIACLVLCTSARKERLACGIFLGVVAVVLLITTLVAAMDIRGSAQSIYVGNLVALSVFCFWKFSIQVLAWLHSYVVATRKLPWEKQEVGMQRSTVRIEGLPREYSYGELQAMTGNFGTLVGHGASGAVFRGVLEDGAVVVAVKRITGAQAMGEEEFMTEITIIASLQHYSLVCLLGYCLLRGGDRYLVLPYFVHGSLDSWLFAGEDKRSRLPWPTRFRMAVDVAKALGYLHHECRQQILHLDIKPANILLDEHFRAHLSDFGISMSIGRDLTTVVTRGRGTIGYMAPEMLVSALSTKCDVYSYGMTLFELVGGRRNLALVNGHMVSSNGFFPRVVKDKLTEGRLMEVVDESLTRGGVTTVPEEEVKVVVQVALWCIQDSRELRPDMPTVVEMLEGRAPVGSPPESRMFMVNFLEPQLSVAVAGDDVAESENRRVYTATDNGVFTALASGR